MLRITQLESKILILIHSTEFQVLLRLIPMHWML